MADLWLVTSCGSYIGCFIGYTRFYSGYSGYYKEYTGWKPYWVYIEIIAYLVPAVGTIGSGLFKPFIHWTIKFSVFEMIQCILKLSAFPEYKIKSNSYLNESLTDSKANFVDFTPTKRKDREN